jgi:hypothetical protein
MSSFEKFIDPIVSIDKISMVINFLPLVDREHAYQLLRKLGAITSNRFDDDITSITSIDWTAEVCDYLQELILGDPSMGANSGGFKRSAKYEYSIQLPVGIHFEYQRNKNVRIIDKIELYGPYKEKDPIRYHSVYETYDTASQIRLEWNPNNTDISILKPFFKLVSFAPGFDPLNDIKITRMDTAVDVSHEIDMSMITSIKSVDQSTYSDRQGGLTKYIGSMSSDRFIRVYNKKIELKKKTKTEHPNEHFYRYEAVKQKGKGFLLCEDDKATEDIFDSLAIIDGERMESCSDPLIKAYFDIARLTESHFDAIVNEGMKGCERKKLWRFKKKFRDYTKDCETHPSIIFNEQFKHVWKKFKTSFLMLFDPIKVK